MTSTAQETATPLQTEDSQAQKRKILDLEGKVEDLSRLVLYLLDKYDNGDMRIVDSYFAGVREDIVRARGDGKRVAEIVESEKKEVVGGATGVKVESASGVNGAGGSSGVKRENKVELSMPPPHTFDILNRERELRSVTYDLNADLMMPQLDLDMNDEGWMRTLKLLYPLDSERSIRSAKLDKWERMIGIDTKSLTILFEESVDFLKSWIADPKRFDLLNNRVRDNLKLALSLFNHYYWHAHYSTHFQQMSSFLGTLLPLIKPSTTTSDHAQEFRTLLFSTLSPAHIPFLKNSGVLDIRSTFISASDDSVRFGLCGSLCGRLSERGYVDTRSGSAFRGKFTVNWVYWDTTAIGRFSFDNGIITLCDMEAGKLLFINVPRPLLIDGGGKHFHLGTGELYSGEIHKGLPHGQGILTLFDKSTIHGQWEHGLYVPPPLVTSLKLSPSKSRQSKSPLTSSRRYK